MEAGDLGAIRSEWEQDGYVHLPGFMSDEDTRRYRAICDGVMTRWYEEKGGRQAIAKATSMHYLTEPRYFPGNSDDLLVLLELIAEERILRLLGALADDLPLFHNTQYFFEQPTQAWDGVWHRDTQFETPDPEVERQRIARSTGVHFRIAFADDPWLEFVPGSHRRWDTPDELAVRLSPELSRRNHRAMPGRRSLKLRKGDALIFSSFGIHRALYRPEPERRTLDLIYHLGRACEYIRPPITCFGDGELLARLSPGAQHFYSRFLAAHRDGWGAERVSWLAAPRRVRVRFDFQPAPDGPTVSVIDPCPGRPER
jgi:phytanoyl-CoA dioxygenase PhyH